MNEAVPPTAEDLPIRINDNPSTFVLHAFRGAADLIYQKTPRTLDLLLLATAVFTADSLVSRGGHVRSDLGAQWARDLHFIVPVDEPDFWRSVHDQLVETLSFLTGDHFAFDFVHRRPQPPRRPGLALGPEIEADRIILLSGGLDSLTGAVDALSTSSDRLLLVTHCSARKTIRMQVELVRQLRSLFPKRFTWVPATGHLIGVDARETTQRSRSFLYGTLGYAAALHVGASRVSFYENGVVSTNLPISRQVVGTMATRTTHPLFLRRLADLLSQVAGRPLALDNPYAWLTKTEVLQRLNRLGHADLIAKTTSCSSVRPQTRAQPLCGCCSQCLDRRFAVLAADLAAFDPAQRYKVDLFLGVRDNPHDRTMAHDWTRTGRRLATMSPGDLAARFGAELADVAAGCSDRPAAQVMSDAFQMLHRHGTSVDAVAQAVVREFAGRILDHDVPAGSLLASLLAPEGALAAESTGAPEHEGGDASWDPQSPLFPLRLVYRPDLGPELLIRGLGEFRGAHIGLIGDLRPYLEADAEAQAAPDQHQWVTAKMLRKSKDAVRQQAHRCRRQFADQFESVEGYRPESEILVHGRTGSGYRLDPEARFEKD